MDIDIAPYIKELLYKNNNLVIPNFGSFALTYASSTIDHVQGVLSAPSKKIDFNHNLITNDGKLLAYIQEKHQLDSKAANEVIQTYVDNISKQLNEREMVIIPEVGRLYKDFENDIQFIADTNNFNKESFGLPSINFYPILREKAATARPAAKIATPTRPTIEEPTPSFGSSLLSSTWLPYVLVALLTIFVATCLFPKLLNRQGNGQVENRINQKPTKLIEDEDPMEDINDQRAEEAAALEEDNMDTESITVNPNQKECIVSIGVFSERENATKAGNEVYERSYPGYNEKFTKNGKTYYKVGIQFGYETEEEYKEYLRRIKRDFPSATVIKK